MIIKRLSEMTNEEVSCATQLTECPIKDTNLECQVEDGCHYCPYMIFLIED